jgi:hypothetical protein
MSYENWIIIRPVGESRGDVNWDGDEHRTCVNQELGTVCRLLYPDIVIVADHRIVARSWTHWALKLYVD